MSERRRATLFMVDPVRGFAKFMAEVDGETIEHFVHASALVGCKIEELEEGDVVSFAASVLSPKGYRAVKVKREERV